jgi:hypothetical protein
MKCLIYLFTLVCIMMSCKKPYNPPATTTNYNYLVIEGLINTGLDSTIFKLSRTVPLASSIANNPESGATITVENDKNGIYVLKEIRKGTYAAAPLNLDTTHKYRLRVKTADGKEYLSDFVQAKNSPPIDSVQYEFSGNAENIYSYTHDPKNNTRYYRWEYQETYLYDSPIASYYIFKNNSIVHINDDDQTQVCYISDTSSTILLNSTAKLTQDVIYKNPITVVPLTLDKLKVRYSILVKQYALTADAYNYYQNLKKNTENLGSIFDAQPSAAATNIHCISNPDVPVLGYITAGSVSQERIFINRSDFYASSVGVDYSYCGEASITYMAAQRSPYPTIISSGADIPIDSLIALPPKPGIKDSTFLIQYAAAECVDCTLKGANKKPAFWK